MTAVRRPEPPPFRDLGYGVTVTRTRRGRWRYRITSHNVSKFEGGYGGWRSYRTAARAWAAAQDRVDRLAEKRADVVTVERSGQLHPTDLPLGAVWREWLTSKAAVLSPKPAPTAVDWLSLRDCCLAVARCVDEFGAGEPSAQACGVYVDHLEAVLDRINGNTERSSTP